jgi:hypothetical protein
LIAKLFPPHMNSNLLTDGTMVVYLNQPSSISPIALNNDQIVVFNDFSSKPSLEMMKLSRKWQRKERFLINQLKSFSLTRLCTCHGLNVSKRRMV